MARPREQPCEYEERDSEEARRERRQELEARFLPSEFQMWDYFTPEGDMTSEERQKQDGADV